MLGHHASEYRGDGFSVRIDQGFRELVTVVHTRDGTALKLGGERIGKKWQGIGIHLASGLDAAQVPQIVHDLAIAFEALRYGYIISRTARVDAVPESERQAALAEINELGFEIQVSADRKQVTQSRRPGVPPPDRKTSERIATRMMNLLQTVRGIRPIVEVLAISKDFERDRELYIPR